MSCVLVPLFQVFIFVAINYKALDGFILVQEPQVAVKLRRELPVEERIAKGRELESCSRFQELHISLVVALVEFYN